MNRLLVLVIAAALLASIPASSLPRHVNPEDVQPEPPSKLGLLELYGLVVASASSENFTAASENLKSLLKIYVPENVKYIYNRFNELLDRELKKLNETLSRLKEAEDAISKTLLRDAEKDLEQAGRSLAEAELIQKELWESVREFSRALGVPLPKLSEKIEDLDGLIEKYRDRLTSLSQELKRLRSEKLIETELTIWVNDTEVEAGSAVEVGGVLRAVNGSGLVGREVSIYLDGKPVGVFYTVGYGVFKGSVKIPYLFRREVGLYAEYAPRGGDLGVFKASRSNNISLSIVYEVPEIEAYVNATNLLPLQSINIYGVITTSRGRIPESIYVKAFGKTVQADVSDNGLFDVVIEVPGTVKPGVHEIILSTKPGRGLAPARKVIAINVYRIPVHLDLEIPSIAVSGVGIQVRIWLSADGKPPGPGELIIESPAGSRSLQVNESSLTFNLTMPLTVFSGVGHVKVAFNPGSPIYEPSSTCKTFFILNPLTILAPISAAIYLARIGLREARRRRKTAAQLIAGVEYEARELVEGKPGKRPGGIVEIYLEAVDLVGRFTGVERKPSDTIREFLEKVSGWLGEASALFSELSYMTEASVYGGVEVDLDLARNLLEGIRGRLYAA